MDELISEERKNIPEKWTACLKGPRNSGDHKKPGWRGQGEGTMMGDDGRRWRCQGVLALSQVQWELFRLGVGWGGGVNSVA